jgi:hypothetical protein
VHQDRSIVRLDPFETESAMANPHTLPFNISGRPMRGWPLVIPQGIKTKAQLKGWVQKGLAFAETLPPK